MVLQFKFFYKFISEFKYTSKVYCIILLFISYFVAVTTPLFQGLNDIATQYALVGDTGITFSTSFYGEAPLDASWQYLSSAVDSSIATADITSTGASFSLSLGTIAMDTIASYDATVELDSCADDVSETLTTTATLEILSEFANQKPPWDNFIK